MKKRGAFRRIFVLLTLTLAIVVGINACKARNEQQKTVIHFVTWKPNIPEVWDKIYEIFEKENPDIKIEKQIGPHSSTAFHDMLTQKLKNRSTDVDVFLMDVVWPAEFAASGWAMPLDRFFSPELKKEFLEGPLMANTYKGHIYGLPLFIDAGVLYYRKDLLQKYSLEPPETWDELVSVAQEIVEKERASGNKIYGYSGQFKQYEGLVCDMQEFILSNGGYILEPETNRVAIADPRAVQAVRFVRDNIIGKIAPRGVLTYQEPESLDLFVQGRAVFHRNWPYAWKVSNDPKKSRIAGKVGISVLPHFKGGRSFSTLGGWQVGISAYTPNPEAAWRFASFLASERVQKLIALMAGKAPTRKSLYRDKEILEKNPHFTKMKDVFLNAYPRPRSPLYPSISEVLQRYLSRAISDPDSDVDTLAKEAKEQIEKILSLTRK
ncbi:MAG: ABC transporter substrate-binding protein [Nitrospirae bacterium]|nr:ABC transporter substrate-binding protein [Nitrospirota bacterium]